MILWEISFDLGYSHPNKLLSDLSSDEYSELISYLSLTKYHHRQKWRDKQLGYISYILTATNSEKPRNIKIEDFMPPDENTKDNKYSGEDVEKGLRFMYSQQKVLSGKKDNK